MNKKLYILFLFCIGMSVANECITTSEYSYYRNEDTSEQQVWDNLRDNATKEFFKSQFNYFYQKTERYIEENETDIIDEYKSYKSFVSAGQIKINIKNKRIEGRQHYAIFEICFDEDEINKEISKRVQNIDESKVIAVVAFVSDGLSSTKRNLFKDKLEEQIKKISPYDLLSYQKVDRILQETGKITTQDCNEAACAVDLGRDLNVDYVLQPNVIYDSTGESTIGLTIFDVESGKVVAKVFEFKKVDSFNDLLRSLDKFVMDLVIKATGGYNVLEDVTETKVNVSNGFISISTTPQGANIILDGQRKGISNKLLKDIEPGEHTLVLSLEGYTRIIKKINVNPGQTTTVNEILPKQMGGLSITSNPPGAKIYLNEDYKGTTEETLSISYLEIGNYTLIARYDDYQEYIEKITVEYDRTNDIVINLEPIPSTVSFFSTPNESKVYIDDKYIGITSTDGLIYDLAPGTYDVVYKYDKYFDIEDQFTTVAGGSKVIDLTLRKMPKGVSTNENAGFLSVNSIPTNTTIKVSGQKYDAPLSYLELDKGKYTVFASSEGFMSEKSKVTINPKRHQEISFKLKQIDTNKSKMRSYIFPGLGHFNSNQYTNGSLFMGAGLASVGLFFSSFSDFSDKKTIADNAYEDYKNATNNIDNYATIYQNAYDDKIESMQIMTGAAVLYGAVWVWNIFDMNKVIKKHKKIYFDLKVNQVKVKVDF